MRRAIYVDYENVNISGLKGIEELTHEDVVKIFIGAQVSKLTMVDADRIFNCEATVELITNKYIGKNALDFIIMVHMGYDIAQELAKSYYIISKDKGYDPAIHEMRKMSGLTVARREDITALLEVKQGIGKKIKGLLGIGKDKETPDTTEHTVVGKGKKDSNEISKIKKEYVSDEPERPKKEQKKQKSKKTQERSTRENKGDRNRQGLEAKADKTENQGQDSSVKESKAKGKVQERSSKGGSSDKNGAYDKKQERNRRNVRQIKNSTDGAGDKAEKPNNTAVDRHTAKEALNSDAVNSGTGGSETVKPEASNTVKPEASNTAASKDSLYGRKNSGRSARDGRDRKNGFENGSDKPEAVSDSIQNDVSSEASNPSQQNAGKDTEGKAEVKSGTVTGREVLAMKKNIEKSDVRTYDNKIESRGKMYDRSSGSHHGRGRRSRYVSTDHEVPESLKKANKSVIMEKNVELVPQNGEPAQEQARDVSPAPAWEAPHEETEREKQRREAFDILAQLENED